MRRGREDDVADLNINLLSFRWDGHVIYVDNIKDFTRSLFQKTSYHRTTKICVFEFFSMYFLSKQIATAIHNVEVFATIGYKVSSHCMWHNFSDLVLLITLLVIFLQLRSDTAYFSVSMY